MYIVISAKHPNTNTQSKTRFEIEDPSFYDGNKKLLEVTIKSTLGNTKGVFPMNEVIHLSDDAWEVLDSK